MARVGKIHINRKRPTTAGPGYVYAIKNPVWPRYVKVGRTIQHPDKRLKDYQVGDPFRAYYLLHSVWVPDQYGAEEYMHQLLAPRHISGEWFTVTDDEVIRLMEAHIAEPLVVTYLEEPEPEPEPEPDFNFDFAPPVPDWYKRRWAELRKRK